MCSTSLVTPVAIFYLTLPIPATPKGRFPPLCPFALAAFAVKRRTSKPKSLDELQLLEKMISIMYK
jgi:hypothetical protein